MWINDQVRIGHQPQDCQALRLAIRQSLLLRADKVNEPAGLPRHRGPRTCGEEADQLCRSGSLDIPRSHMSVPVPFQERVPSKAKAQTVALQAPKKWINPLSACCRYICVTTDK